MNEISSVIRLKDRIIIAILLSVFALLIATAAGVVAIVTKDDTPGSIDGGNVGGVGSGDNANSPTHAHTYKYEITKNSDGEFDFVGTCTDASCSDPKMTWRIEGGIVDEIKVEATCCSLGEKVYYFTSPFDQITYSYTEQIPFGPHDYVGEILISDGVGSINVSCSRSACTVESIVLDNVVDLQFKNSDPATCISDRRDYYTCTVNGSEIIVSTYVESDEFQHILNGVPESEYYIYDNVIGYGTENVYTADGIPLLSCGMRTDAVYICGGCGETVHAVIGTQPHSFDFDSAEITQYPDFTQSGEAKVKCTNEGCTHEEKITLPKASEEENATLVETDEENKKQTWLYTYTDDKYGHLFAFEIVIPWEHDHQFVYVDDKTKDPTIYRDGEFVVKCTICELEKKHTLPKINEAEGGNSRVLSEATEDKPKTYEYTYEAKTYGFTLVREIEIGDKLTHSYVYELDLTTAALLLQAIVRTSSSVVTR